MRAHHREGKRPSANTLRGVNGMDATRRVLLLAACATLALLASSASASADTLCVGSPGGPCTATFADVQAALNAAATVSHPGDDTVKIDANTYSAGPYSYGSNTNGHVSIVGAGPSQTTL